MLLCLKVKKAKIIFVINQLNLFLVLNIKIQFFFNIDKKDKNNSNQEDITTFNFQQKVNNKTKSQKTYFAVFQI